MGKEGTISIKIKDQTRIPTSILLFSIVPEVLARASREEKEIQQICAERRKANYPYLETADSMYREMERPH